MGANNDNIEESFKSSISLIDYILISVVVVILSITSFVLIRNLNQQNASYQIVKDQVLAQALTQPSDQAINRSAILVFSRAQDFANVKTSSMFIGCLLIFTGALYLIKVFNITYSLDAKREGAGSLSLSSSSPGLVMVTLGVGLVISVMLIKNEVSYEFESKTDLNNNLEKAALGLSTPKETTRSRQNESIPKNSFIPFNGATPIHSNEQIEIIVKNLVAQMKANPSMTITLFGRSNEDTAIMQMTKENDMVNFIRKLLVERQIQSSRIIVKSYGEQDHRASDDDEEAVNGVSISFSISGKS